MNRFDSFDEILVVHRLMKGGEPDSALTAQFLVALHNFVVAFGHAAVDYRQSESRGIVGLTGAGGSLEYEILFVAQHFGRF